MNKVSCFEAGLFIGFIVLVIVLVIMQCVNPIILSQKTGNEICLNFTSQSGVVASVDNGKLVCYVPSFDSTQNIIIKKNSDKENE